MPGDYAANDDGSLVLCEWRLLPREEREKRETKRKRRLADKQTSPRLFFSFPFFSLSHGTLTDWEADTTITLQF